MIGSDGEPLQHKRVQKCRKNQLSKGLDTWSKNNASQQVLYKSPRPSAWHLCLGSEFHKYSTVSLANVNYGELSVIKILAIWRLRYRYPTLATRKNYPQLFGTSRISISKFIDMLIYVKLEELISRNIAFILISSVLKPCSDNFARSFEKTHSRHAKYKFFSMFFDKNCKKLTTRILDILIITRRSMIAKIVQISRNSLSRCSRSSDISLETDNIDIAWISLPSTTTTTFKFDLE